MKSGPNTTQDMGFNISSKEWQFAKEQIERQKQADPSLSHFKISRNEHPSNLGHSFITIRNARGEDQVFAFADMLGKGSFGKVKLLIDEAGNKYAVKISDAAKRNVLETEIEILNDLNNLLGEFIRTRSDEKFDKHLNRKIKDKHYLIQTFIPGNNLAQGLAAGEFSPLQKTEMALLAAQSLAELHEKDIVHRDVKALNYMLSTDQKGAIEQVRAIDFGLSVRMGGKSEVKIKAGGTPKYFAPELDAKRISQATLEAYSAMFQYNQAVKQLEQLKNSQVYSKEKIKNLQDRNEKIKKFFTEEGKLDIEELVKDKDKLHELSLTITDDLLYDKIERNLDKYNDNLAEIVREKSTLQVIENNFSKGVEELKIIKEDAVKKQVSQNQLMNQELPISKAVDVYALGIMYSEDMGMDLNQLGLSGMLAENPEDRMTITEVKDTLQARLVEQSEQQKEMEHLREISDHRVPDLVPTNRLHRVEKNQLSLLSQNQLEHVKNLGEEYKNKIIEISVNGKPKILPPVDVAYLASKKIEKFNKNFIMIDETGTPFLLYKQLGAGSVGRAYLTQNLNDGSWAVLKMISGPVHKVGQHITAMKEENTILQNLGQLRGTLSSTSVKQRTFAGVQTFAHGEEYYTLQDKSKKEGKPLPAMQSVLMAKKAVESLAKLHEEGYLHRDIKLENLIWDDKDKKCHIIDYGNAVVGLEKVDETIKGTQGYLAPELDAAGYKKMFLNGRTYNTQTDLYSMGEVIVRLSEATQAGPQQEALKELAMKLKSENPLQRPTAKEAVATLDRISKMEISTQKPTVQTLEKSSEHRAAPIVRSMNLDKAKITQEQSPKIEPTLEQQPIAQKKSLDKP